MKTRILLTAIILATFFSASSHADEFTFESLLNLVFDSQPATTSTGESKPDPE